MRRSHPATVLAALVLAGMLAGCADDSADPKNSGSSPTPSDSPTSDGPESPATQSPTPEPSGGTAADPTPADETTALLDWSPVPGSTDDTVTVSGNWTLGYPQQGTEAVLDGPRPVTVRAPDGFRITDALIDGEYAVVVAQHEQESKPNVATVIDLASGKKLTLDGSSDVPTTTGGTWALGEGTLLHATIGPHRAYCLASVDLATRKSTRGWCAPPRHGFNNARITPAGSSLLTFDDQRPSCRTVAEVDGGQITPFPGVTECKGWDGALLEGGAVWSVVPDENRIEQAKLVARVGDGYFDLGPGTSGSLVPCAGSAYFVREPQRDGDPARLLRWSPDGELAVVYETGQGGQATLSSPRCGGDTVTVTALTSKGDEQVSAPVS
jgi:hypothetical protein